VQGQSFEPVFNAATHYPNYIRSLLVRDHKRNMGPKSHIRRPGTMEGYADDEGGQTACGRGTL